MAEAFFTSSLRSVQRYCKHERNALPRVSFVYMLIDQVAVEKFSRVCRQQGVRQLSSQQGVLARGRAMLVSGRTCHASLVMIDFAGAAPLLAH
ncbi:hypothetical protein [Polaromonas sp.]|uniref:hypothetical protein n=1 Tax=Polaromonas sp. TaxID=1869339 RepID=UPI002FC759A0